VPLILFILAFYPFGAASADGTVESLDTCFVSAAQRYGLNTNLLKAIAVTENAALDPGAINRNTEHGSVDVGIMQINSYWWGKLKEFGLSPADLLDPCVSIHVGAWILAQNIQVHGNNWESVGAYNAKSSAKRYRYATKVKKNLARITGR